MSVLIAYPNRTDLATLSNGSWQPLLPLVNLQNRIISKVARTIDVNVTSTKFDVALDKERLIQAMAIVNHNLSGVATYRIRASGETSVTNEIIYSEQFANAVWSDNLNNIIVTSNTSSAPDSTTNADTLTESTSTGYFYTYQTTRSVATSLNVFSVFCKQGSGIQRYLSLRLENLGTNNGVDGIFDVENGLVTYNQANGTCTSASAEIQSIGNGWWRCSVSAICDTVSTGYLSALVAITNSSTAPIASYSGNGTSSLILWGAQLEPGVLPTSYYPSAAGAGVRSSGYIDNWQSYQYDSAVQPVWPIVYTYGILEWEDDNWWAGTTLDEDKIGYNLVFTNILAEAVFCTNLRFEFFDTTNPTGYVQFGRLFLSTAWLPTINMSIGASLGYETQTVVDTTLSGADYFDRRTPYRVAKFDLKWMTEDEGNAFAFDMQRLLGVDQEVLFMWDINDTVHRLRRTFVGRLRVLSQIDMPYLDVLHTPFEIKELI